MKMNNQVYVIGAGAVGKTLAVLLQNEGKDVKLIRGRATEEARASEQIKVQLLGGERIEQSLSIDTLSQYTKLDGTIVITTKSYGNADLAAALSSKIGKAEVVLLQNGLQIEQPFMGQAYNSVMRCVLFVTAQVADANTVRFKPVRPSLIGVVHGNKDRLAEVVSHLTTASFPFTQEADIQPVIWKKAIINCVFNSICPLLETDNGIFHREKEVLELGMDIIREGMAVAQENGIHLKESDIVEQLLQISKTSDGQLISTFQDIIAKRPTEIETLNLAVAQMGNDLGKETLVQRNALLGKLIWWKSKLHR
jgi:2-dehydropantoate 2-reductase